MKQPPRAENPKRPAADKQISKDTPRPRQRQLSEIERFNKARKALREYWEAS
ncbi:MAG: hypothetical protein ACO280_05180 [Pseudohongiellaceae bacterium]|jgi:hypothetical protein